MKKLGQKSVDKLAQDDTVVNSKAGIQIQANLFPSLSSVIFICKLLIIVVQQHWKGGSVR